MKNELENFLNMDYWYFFHTNKNCRPNVYVCFMTKLNNIYFLNNNSFYCSNTIIIPKYLNLKIKNKIITEWHENIFFKEESIARELLARKLEEIEIKIFSDKDLPDLMLINKFT